ncbi:MAG: NAD(P)-dependent alcohol dehydrogenase [Myxococcales bacterium]|nr:NAD(P)-dependent alcohol dehydrogenase [Myxococcales bacterium]
METPTQTPTQTRMRALAVRRRPGVGELAGCLESIEVPIPEPGPKEVRVRVCACSINIDDQHLAERTMLGGLPIGPKPTEQRPYVPGADLAGVVEAVGGRVEGLAVGDAVFGIANPIRGKGAWAQYCCTQGRSLHRVPEGWSLVEAAACGLSSTVACAAIAGAGPIEGRTCVVVGASGGIGGLLTQILDAAGAEVVGVCSGRNAELVRALGARRVLDYTQGAFGDALVADGTEVAYVFDFVGGRDVEAQARRILPRSGRFVTIVGPERFVGETRLGWTRIARMLGYTLWRMLASRTRGPRYVFAGPLAPPWAEIERLVLEPEIRPTIDREVTFEVDAVAEAIRYVASHRARGKVVIRVADEPG